MKAAFSRVWGGKEAEEIHCEQPTAEGSAAPKSSPERAAGARLGFGVWAHTQGWGRFGAFPGGAFPLPLEWC